MWNKAQRLGWIIVLALAACIPLGKAAPPTPTVEALSPSATPIPQVSPGWTPTPPPAPAGVFLAPEGADPALTVAARQALDALAVAQGWTVATVSAVDQIPPGAQLVMAIPPAQASAVAQAWPQVPVVTLGVLPDTPPPNLFALDLSPYTPDRLAFAAGYLAALTAPDFRVGAVFLADEATETAIAAFTQGVAYYCGLCRPAFPPFVTYPVWATLPATADADTWLSTAETLAQQYAANRIYLAWPDAGAARGHTGAETTWQALTLGYAPPPEGATGDLWGGVDLQAGLRTLWEQGIQQGQTRSVVPPFVLQGFSPGRARWATATLAKLWTGAIAP